MIAACSGTIGRTSFETYYGEKNAVIEKAALVK